MSQHLILLRQKADEACAEAAEQNRLDSIVAFDDSVNWTNVRCVEARHWVDDLGNEGDTVIIEEAAPDATRLQAWVAEYLKQNGYANTEVVTQW